MKSVYSKENEASKNGEAKNLEQLSEAFIMSSFFFQFPRGDEGRGAGEGQGAGGE